MGGEGLSLVRHSVLGEVVQLLTVCRLHAPAKSAVDWEGMLRAGQRSDTPCCVHTQQRFKIYTRYARLSRAVALRTLARVRAAHLTASRLWAFGTGQHKLQWVRKPWIPTCGMPPISSWPPQMFWPLAAPWHHGFRWHRLPDRCEVTRFPQAAAPPPLSWRPQNPSFASRKWTTFACLVLYLVLCGTPLWGPTLPPSVVHTGLAEVLIPRGSVMELALLSLLAAQMLLPALARPKLLQEADKKAPKDRTPAEQDAAVVFSCVVVKAAAMLLSTTLALLAAAAGAYGDLSSTWLGFAGAAAAIAAQSAVATLLLGLLDETLRMHSLFKNGTAALIATSAATNFVWKLFSWTPLTTQSGGDVEGALTSLAAPLLGMVSGSNATSPQEPWVSTALARMTSGVPTLMGGVGTLVVLAVALGALGIAYRTKVYLAAHRKPEVHTMAPVYHALPITALVATAVLLHLPALMAGDVSGGGLLAQLAPVRGLLSAAPLHTVFRSMYVVMACFLTPRLWAECLSPALTREGLVASLTKRNVKIQAARNDPAALDRVLGSAAALSMTMGPLVLAACQLCVELTGAFASAPVLFVVARFLGDSAQPLMLALRGVDVDLLQAQQHAMQRQAAGPSSGQRRHPSSGGRDGGRARRRK